MQNNSPLMPIGRVLMALIFLVAGVQKLMNYAATSGHFASLGIPVPEVVLPLTILLEIGGALALIIGWRTAWVAGLLALFCVGSAVLGHAFWAAEGPQFGNQLTQFLKNIALAGGFLVLAAASSPRR